MQKLKHMVGSKMKIFFWATVALLLIFSISPRGYAQTVDTAEPTSFPYTKKFVVSSYYTPLPGQNYYITGSFEGDVRLNGEGVHAADGSLVYPGLAAAPKRFPFGTKMNVAGFGIVAIHDRGGAIKADRLDIWVGSGDEGLRRALAWGMRTVDVTVYGVDASIQESVNIDAMPLAAARTNATAARTKYFNENLAYGDDGEDVEVLQLFLKKLGYFSADITGFYGDETTAAVRAFQLTEKILDSAEDTGAGNFGPRTRVSFEAALERKKTQSLAMLPQILLQKGMTGHAVQKLQETLKSHGFLKEITYLYDETTIDAVTRFQIDVGIVKDASEFGAGVYGPKTQEALEKIVAQEYIPTKSFDPAPKDEDAPTDPSPAASPAPVAIKNIFTKELALNETGSDVALLQEELSRLHFFGLAPTGFYGKTTEHAVFKFQQSLGIITDKESPGAGSVGPKTLAVLNDLAGKRTNQKQLIADTTEKKEIVAERLEEEKMLVAGEVSPQLFLITLEYGASGTEVETLQRVLKRLGFFPGILTTKYFGDVTKKSLIAFQKSHFVEETGTFDEQTRKIINLLVAGV